MSMPNLKRRLPLKQNARLPQIAKTSTTKSASNCAVETKKSPLPIVNQKNYKKRAFFCVFLHFLVRIFDINIGFLILKSDKMSVFSREKNCFSPQKININFAKCNINSAQKININ